MLYLENEFCHLETALQYNAEGFQRNIFMKLKDFSAWRKKHSQYGMFTTAYRYDNENIREANMIGDLYIDFDVPEIEDNFYMIRTDAMRVISSMTAIFGIDKEMMKIYYSGSKGIHIVIPSEIIGIHPNPQLNNIFKLIAIDLNNISKHKTIDTRIYDKVRLFRVPNSYHPRSGLYKIPITFDELRDLSLAELQTLAVKPRAPFKQPLRYCSTANRIYQSYIKQWDDEVKRDDARRKGSKERKLNFTPPCIEHILTEGVREGKRNNTVAVLASYHMQRGLSLEETYEQLNIWNEEFCNPSLSTSEIEKTANSIYRADHRYGCSALRELSICSPSCRVYKEPIGRP
jgi:hypothetical protein